VLLAEHKELADATKTALAQTLAKAAQQIAKREALPVSNPAQLRDVCLAAARIFGWDGPSVSVQTSVTNNTLIISEAEQARLIAQRQRLLEAGNGRKIEATVPIALPAQERQSDANVGTGKGIVAQNQSPATKPDPVVLEMESIGNAASWKHGKGSDHAGSFGPWPEEYE
jgi:hypothetical protein